MAAADRRPFRRRATTLAVLLMLAGTAEAFDIPTGNPDLALRWDNTFRYNLGFRTQSQDPNILASPNFDDGDRNFSNGSIVTNRLDLLSEFDLIYQRKHGFRVSAAGWYDDAYGNLDNNNNVTANTLSGGLPAAGILSPYTKRYAKGLSGEFLDAFAFTTSTSPTCRSTSRRDSTPSIGARACFSAAPSTAFRIRRTRSTCGKASQRPAVRRRSCSGHAGAYAAGAADARSDARWPVVLQLAGDPPARVGQLPDGQRRRVLGRRIADLRSQSFGSRGSRRARIPSIVEHEPDPAIAHERRPRRFRSGGALEPEWLDGTLGFYYRNTTDITPQLVVTPGFSPRCLLGRARPSAAFR
jgi:hypothetical protein